MVTTYRRWLASLAYRLPVVVGMTKFPDTPQDAVEMLVRLAEKARREGKPSLAADAQHADNALLGEGLRLLAAGAGEAEINAAMGRQVTLAAGTTQEGRGQQDAMMLRLVQLGILSIAAGDDPDTIRTKLRDALSPA